MIEPVASEQRIDRRTVVKSAAAAAGITVLTGVAATLNGAGANQIDLGTPQPATPGSTVSDPVTPLGPTIASKAAELGYDTERIFRFVADDVRYEAYAGALRGANGTLWSLAGNSVDKSILLSALLDEALVEHRFATGKLDDAGIATLAAAMVPGADLLMSSYATAFAAGFAPQTSGVLGGAVAGPEPTLGDEDRAALDELSMMADKAFGLAQSLAETQLDIIGDALQAANIVLPVLPAAILPATETDRHVWVQVADGPNWIDYAPALGTELSGVAPATVAETFGKIPDDLHHQLTIRIVAEEYFGGKSVRRDVVTMRGPSTALVNAPVAVAVLPPDSFEGLGFTINELFTGNASFMPMLLAKDLYVVADTPIVFGSGGEGLFDEVDGTEGDASGPANGETLALWLVVDIASPGSEPVSTARPLLDRIGIEARQQATIDFSIIEPVELVGEFDGSPIVPELAAAHLLTVDVARLPFSYALGNAKDLETYGPILLNAPSVTAFRDGLRLQAELAASQHSYISEPQVTLTSIALVDAANPESAVRMDIDLLYHNPAVVTFPAATSRTEGTQPNVYAGVLNQVAEMVVFHPDLVTGVEESGMVVGPNVASILSAAVDNDIPIITISNLDDIANLELGFEANALVEQALADGWIAIAPERPVAIGDEERSGWWLIDPATGRTKDQLDNGRSYASIVLGSSGKVFVEGGENSIMYRIGLAVGRAFRFIGRNARCIFSATTLNMAAFAGLFAYRSSVRGSLENVVGVAASLGVADRALALVSEGGVCA